MNTYSVNALSVVAVFWTVFLALILPLAIAFGATFLIAGNARWMPPILVGSLTLPLTILLLAQLFVAKISLTDQYHIVGGGLYKERLSMTDLRIDALTRIDLTRDPDALGARVNGIGLPGLSLGWFQPSQGKKLFALVSRPDAVLLPTIQSFDLLISPVDADRFIADLRKAKG